LGLDPLSRANSEEPRRDHNPRVGGSSPSSGITNAFTLATYVHLLDGDLGEPLAILQEGGHNAALAG
jgi:hypothetical protein